MDYSEFDRELDGIELALRELVRTHDLRQTRIERWRWDVPEITLTWQGEDLIWRSITTFLAAVRQGYIEVNAWRDTPRDGGWFRRWNHIQVRSGSVEAYPWCTAAYNEVASWDSLPDTFPARRHID
jgi:hypothetical protein